MSHCSTITKGISILLCNNYNFLHDVYKNNIPISNIPEFYISESQDPEGPPYIPYEEILPTKESNALIGGILTVDENRGDVPAKTEKTSEVLETSLLYDYEDLDENMLLNLEGIGVFGPDFSKKVEEEITDEPQVVLDVENPKDPQKVQQRFFESGMRADSQETYFQRNQMRRRFRPR